MIFELLAAAAAHAAAGPLLPITPKDYDAFQFEKTLPGEDQGAGGEFAQGSRRYLRLDGRHLKIRTAAGLQTCIVSQAAATAIAAGRGSADCHGVRVTLRPRLPAGSLAKGGGVASTLIATQAGVSHPIGGAWQALD